jgi:hypothetical protein
MVHSNVVFLFGVYDTNPSVNVADSSEKNPAKSFSKTFGRTATLPIVALSNDDDDRRSGACL